MLLPMWYQIYCRKILIARKKYLEWCLEFTRVFGLEIVYNNILICLIFYWVM